MFASPRGTTAHGRLYLGGDLTYSERPIKLLDMVKLVTRNKVINMCKVQ
jgi:hypothetical protein